MATENDVPAPRTRSRESRDARVDGRRQFLVYLDEDLIRRIKQASLDDGRFTYEIVEEVLQKNLPEIEKEADRRLAIRKMQQRDSSNSRQED